MKNFLDCAMDSVYVVKNIRFMYDGKDMSQRLFKVSADEINYYLDADYDDATATVMYVRSKLMYGKIDVVFDFEQATDETHDDILAKHEATIEQPWNADIVDVTHWKSESLDCYHVTWPDTWYCVVPSDYSCYLDKDVAHKLAEQLVFEYLLATLPIIVS